MHVAGEDALRLGLRRRHRSGGPGGRSGARSAEISSFSRSPDPRSPAPAPSTRSCALALDRRLGGAHLVDAVADHFHRLGDERRHALLDALGGQRLHDLAVGRLARTPVPARRRRRNGSRTRCSAAPAPPSSRRPSGWHRSARPSARLSPVGDQVSRCRCVGQRRAHVAAQRLDALRR